MDCYRDQKLSRLSLKSKKTDDPNGLPNKRICYQKDSIVPKNLKSEDEDIFDDNFLDDVNLTQVLGANDVSPGSTNKSDKSQLTQFFEDSQVLKEIDESIMSHNIQKSLKSVKSENFGDLLNEKNRENVEDFFNNIEHSVSILGTSGNNIDQSINKIIDAYNSQAVNDTFQSKDLSISDINASFASALKKVYLANMSKEKTVLEDNKHEGKIEVKKFIEMGPFYGLPVRVKQLIKLYKGIDDLYSWQNECLNLPAIKNRSNLIYALPTSGGKTLVSEILMLREVICYKRNAIFVLPYVAIVQEKVWSLSPFAVALDFLVEEYASSKGIYPPRKRRRKNSIYIATIEKALGLINSLIETGRIDEIGLIVVDELHLIGESDRGTTLEAFLTKVLFAKADIQIIGMSATIGNVDDLCNFLNAEKYSENFRPVELIEYIKCGPEIAQICYSNKEEQLFRVVRKLENNKQTTNNIDPDKLGLLVMEVIPNDSCLIFCYTKKNCENVAHLLTKVVDKKVLEYKKEEKLQIKYSLKDESGVLCKILNSSIPFGIAYHHSGLTNEERRIIEDAFRAGIISVICCTSTLAAGVNLPAKRVILRQPYIGKDFISLSRYKQMVGRAGRAGLGETGDSIVICNNTDLDKVKKLLKSPMDEALSGMHSNEAKGLKRLFLSCISLGVANTRMQLLEVSRKTLLAIQSERSNVNLKKLTDKVIGDLFKMGAVQEADLCKQEAAVDANVTVRLENSMCDNSYSDLNSSLPNGKRKIVLKNTTKLVVSKLGCAATKGNFELSRAHKLYDDLYNAQKSLVLLDSLHLLYLVTPYEIAEQIRPNKNDYYNIYCKLNPKELHTARILGIDDAVAMKLLANQPIKTVPETTLNRFFLTLMLHELWNGKLLYQVSEKYQVNRGIVQNLMTGSASFASNVVSFCEQLEEFWTFALLFKGMSQRLSHCCVKEILPLMELPAVKQNRAKQLYNAGFKSIRSIAAANPDSLMENIEYMSLRVAKQLIAAAKMLLLEKVENLREEAEDVLDGCENTKTLIQN